MSLKQIRDAVYAAVVSGEHRLAGIVLRTGLQERQADRALQALRKAGRVVWRSGGVGWVVSKLPEGGKT